MSRITCEILNRRFLTYRILPCFKCLIRYEGLHFIASHISRTQDLWLYRLCRKIVKPSHWLKCVILSLYALHYLYISQRHFVLMCPCSISNLIGCHVNQFPFECHRVISYVRTAWSEPSSRISPREIIKFCMNLIAKKIDFLILCVTDRRSFWILIKNIFR